MSISFLHARLLSAALSAIALAALCGWGLLSADGGWLARWRVSLPPERFFYVAREHTWSAPEALRSNTPVACLRERNGGGYELLYWGNPVRPTYAYRMREIASGRSVLLSPKGKRQPSRPLPMGASRRADGLLPLQLVLPIPGVEGSVGQPRPVRLEILDARTGEVLCGVDYLIEGNQTTPF